MSSSKKVTKTPATSATVPATSATVPEVTKTETTEETAPAVAAPTTTSGQMKNPFTDLIKSKEVDIKRNREELISLKDDEKWFKKEFTELAKIRKKKEAKALANADKPVKKPSGFAMECELSVELSSFLHLPAKSSLTRPAVHKLVTNYIKEKNLEDEKSRKIIHPDAALAKILGVSDKPDEIVTYLNLQHYLKHHFVKNAEAVQAAPKPVVN